MRSFELALGLAAALAIAVPGAGVHADWSKTAVKHGKPISEADLTAWDIDIRTNDGKGLPPGKGSVADGKKIYVEKCLTCHGEDATGLREMGAPNLTDDVWLYGGDADALFHTVHDGRQGWMPSWEDRMSLAERKIVSDDEVAKSELPLQSLK